MQNQKSPRKKQPQRKPNPKNRAKKPRTKSAASKTTPKKKKKNNSNTHRNGYKIPEALPTEQYKEPKLEKFRQVVLRKKPEIKEIVREPTAGGIVFRMTPDQKDIEILLIQDSKNRWTIPKGHIEPGETAKQTAIREIGEESGLKHVDVLSWLGKIHFKYRRLEKLVLMTTQVYLVQSLDKNEHPTKEKWMNGIRWFSFADALDAIEYADIEKLMLIAKRKIRSGEY
ncbi:NUDIX domain-containing protein [Candidatus Saccharibacteria bacterium]|nr:NUDIX domain-containing protein [Candidatus Saccharibacteria bacterium]MBP5656740.1 NUDIX domain-containing protein [Candidatus Saccharibacteria bacterium]